jgi:hypothetical protein
MDDPKAKGGGMPVTDGLRVMGFRAERIAYRPWAITMCLLREPSGQFPKAFVA